MAIYEYFAKFLGCSYYYTYTDSILNINVPLHSTIEKEKDKVSAILHNCKLGKMKDELCKTTDDGATIVNTIIEACFLKANAYCYTSVKEQEEKKLKGIT